MAGVPRPFPVRRSPAGSWEVEVIDPPSPARWVPTESEENARAISRSLVLRHEIVDAGRSGPDVASECRATAAVLQRYGFGSLSRWFAAAADRLDREDASGCTGRLLKNPIHSQQTVCFRPHDPQLQAETAC
jgi:hypothetical protein